MKVKLHESMQTLAQIEFVPTRTEGICPDRVEFVLRRILQYSDTDTFVNELRNGVNLNSAESF